eukprot:m.306086 g.306086  ORF g.306086 m.306086 type:complete len:154 (+) comp40957_c0_seq1:567-1028(+)
MKTVVIHATIILAYLFPAVSAVCDPTKCCCPDKTATAKLSGNIVTISYRPVAGSTCASGNPPAVVSLPCPLVSGKTDQCMVTSPFVFSVQKSGSKVSVTDANEATCNVVAVCESGACDGNADNWDGTYAIDGSTAVGGSVATAVLALLYVVAL